MILFQIDDGEKYPVDRWSTLDEAILDAIQQCENGVGVMEFEVYDLKGNFRASINRHDITSEALIYFADTRSYEFRSLNPLLSL